MADIRTSLSAVASTLIYGFERRLEYHRFLVGPLGGAVFEKYRMSCNATTVYVLCLGPWSTSYISFKIMSAGKFKGLQLCRGFV